MAIFQTKNGTRYFKSPHVVLMAATDLTIFSIQDFLGGFDDSLNFKEYQKDICVLPDTSDIDTGYISYLPSETLCKFAGQLCYLSFGQNRTLSKDARKYFKNILESGHGSVLEHASYSLLIYGISRSLTHEFVRHRAGFAYSQVSQRYVDGDKLQFVERPEYQNDPVLHAAFEERIDVCAKQYKETANYLAEKQLSGDALLSGDKKTDLRKKVQQTARSVLPNECATAMVVTGNARAWRHFLSMRCSAHAEIEIRNLAFLIYEALLDEAPLLFEDFSPVELPDGTKSLTTTYPKV